MDCSCVRNHFDFDISYSSCCTKLVYTDLSEWMDDDHYNVPDGMELEITTPKGDTKAISVKPEGTTIINSDSIFGVTKEITDGIYCFKFTNCGSTYTKNIAITCQLRSKIDDLYVRECKSDEEIDGDKLCDLQRWLKYIEVNAMHGCTDVAKEYFKLSHKLCESLSRDCPSCNKNK